MNMFIFVLLYKYLLNTYRNIYSLTFQIVQSSKNTYTILKEYRARNIYRNKNT